MKAIGYTRVSTEEQARSGLGLSDQNAKIIAYCTLKDLDLVDMFEDAACSGAKSLALRPAGSSLCKVMGRKPLPNVVVMLKLDRGFRNAADCLQTVESWIKGGVALHVIDMGGNAVDTSTAAGKFMLTVLAGAAEMERNLTCERTKAALDVKRKRGERISRHPPFGWRIEGRMLRRVEGEQKALARMRELRHRGLSYQKISNVLTAEGMLSRAGSPISSKTILMCMRRMSVGNA